MIGVVSAPLWDTASATFAGKFLSSFELCPEQVADKQECSLSKTLFISFNTTTTPQVGRTLHRMLST